MTSVEVSLADENTKTHQKDTYVENFFSWISSNEKSMPPLLFSRKPALALEKMDIEFSANYTNSLRDSGNIDSIKNTTTPPKEYDDKI